MKFTTLKLLLAALLTCGLAGAMSNIVTSDEPDELSFNACGAGAAKRAVKVTGVDGTKPVVCKLNGCRPIGSTATATGWTGNTPPTLVIMWAYQVQGALAPTNYCPPDVEAATFAGP